MLQADDLLQDSKRECERTGQLRESESTLCAQLLSYVPVEGVPKQGSVSTT